MGEYRQELEDALNRIDQLEATLERLLKYRDWPRLPEETLYDEAKAVLEQEQTPYGP